MQRIFLRPVDPKPANLGQVVQHGHQLPLAVDILLATYAESFDPDGEVGAVDMATQGGVLSNR